MRFLWLSQAPGRGRQSSLLRWQRLMSRTSIHSLGLHRLSIDDELGSLNSPLKPWSLGHVFSFNFRTKSNDDRQLYGPLNFVPALLVIGLVIGTSYTVDGFLLSFHYNTIRLTSLISQRQDRLLVRENQTIIACLRATLFATDEKISIS